jgi:hypothetical protein
MSETILPDNSGERLWYFHDKCKVYGYMLVRACWYCHESEGVVQAAPRMVNEAVGASAEELL